MMRHFLKRKTATQGFSLIEMMIALTILAFGLMGITAMQINAMRGAKGSKNLPRAVEISQGQIERLSRLDWTDLPAGAWTTPVAATTTVDSGVAQIDNTYMIDQRVTDVVAGQTRSIDVRVSWTDPRRGGRSFSLTTLKFNNGN